jgi:hypothetical protein
MHISHDLMNSISHHKIATALSAVLVVLLAVLLAPGLDPGLDLGIKALWPQAATAAAPMPAAQPGSAKVVADYSVFFDPPTAFVFVKLPAGWKFAGKVEGADVAKLPAGVVTYLLHPDSEEDRKSRLATSE